MRRNSSSSFLEEEVELLAEHFGVDSVRTALARVSSRPIAASEPQACEASTRSKKKPNPSISNLLERLRPMDEEKHRLLTSFYVDLKNRKLLPESQDIRQFAQIIGLKEIGGKSREDLVPKLMRFLIGEPTGRLQVDIQRAAGVSEEQRQQGYSVLTDKLLGGR